MILSEMAGTKPRQGLLVSRGSHSQTSNRPPTQPLTRCPTPPLARQPTKTAINQRTSQSTTQPYQKFINSFKGLSLPSLDQIYKDMGLQPLGADFSLPSHPKVSSIGGSRGIGHDSSSPINECTPHILAHSKTQAKDLRHTEERHHTSNTNTDSSTRPVVGGKQSRQRCPARGSACPETQADDLGHTEERHHTSDHGADSSTRPVVGGKQSRQRCPARGSACPETQTDDLGHTEERHHTSDYGAGSEDIASAEDATDVGVGATKGQPLLCLGPDGKSFIDSQSVARRITKTWKKHLKFDDYRWSKVPEDEKDRLFVSFLGFYRLAPGTIPADYRVAFDTAISDRMFDYICKQQAKAVKDAGTEEGAKNFCPRRCTQDRWNKFCAIFQTDEFKNRSSAEKKNRAKVQILSTSGCKSFRDVRRELEDYEWLLEPDSEHIGHEALDLHIIYASVKEKICRKWLGQIHTLLYCP